MTGQDLAYHLSVYLDDIVLFTGTAKWNRAIREVDVRGTGSNH